ncbi:flavodoxin family protein [Clostridioides difficile]|nr:flavodoxin domain protein [Clostridioides difficile]EQF54213.1 flavodoxin domain protein [Clostridioides difficile CD181]MCI4308369.1 flavodoxin family protein [Clostridioides difficile]MCI4311590.1 flavodoxin family protein [Clostridioides difficile]MCI4759450.1 flavodoxin family protein [Clostridioides difficile]MCK1943551.1 flavodoxin family protein [Clostridioides difficile]
MCQGEMPIYVRERYEKMLAVSIRAPNLEGMVENFDKDLSHPNETDLIELKNAISK